MKDTCVFIESDIDKDQLLVGMKSGRCAVVDSQSNRIGPIIDVELSLAHCASFANESNSIVIAQYERKSVKAFQCTSGELIWEAAIAKCTHRIDRIDSRTIALSSYDRQHSHFVDSASGHVIGTLRGYACVRPMVPGSGLALFQRLPLGGWKTRSTVLYDVGHDRVVAQLESIGDECSRADIDMPLCVYTSYESCTISGVDIDRDRLVWRVHVGRAIAEATGSEVVFDDYICLFLTLDKGSHRVIALCRRTKVRSVEDRPYILVLSTLSGSVLDIKEYGVHQLVHADCNNRALWVGVGGVTRMLDLQWEPRDWQI